jgi:hypothetical protein
MEGSHVQSRSVRRQSELRIGSLPLVSVAFGADPESGDAGEAHGVIALGDRARGVLALGGQARGFIALGGRAHGVFAMGGQARGVFAMGGMALGLVAVGGLAVGLAAVGGAALGLVSLGGASAGYLAAGGAAWGRHSFSAPSRPAGRERGHAGRERYERWGRRWLGRGREEERP